MYLPDMYEVHDHVVLLPFMARFNFATLVTADAGVPFASHVTWEVHPQRGPLGTLNAHVARPNPQWQHFANSQEVLVIFQGDHGYISPSWYASTQPTVPTWNYMAVHAYGVPHILEDNVAVYRHLRALVHEHETSIASPWQMDEAYMEKLARGVVAFEIEITRLEGKFKLSQNKTERDRAGVIAALVASPHPSDHALAGAMQEHT
ncbi:MAG: FMN-binding negative transcriptional regulator [Herpetosiphonaceae bacterium]|nr:FMN-binding negative transcriptional regulator [Herpetosiphonaceae bacterium]